MQTILDSLKSVNAYPVPFRTLYSIAEGRYLSLDSFVSQEILVMPEYRLATADLLLWLSKAPNVSQGGQTYSFTDEQRRQMRQEAQTIYDELEPSSNAGCVVFGYKGDRL